MDSVTIITDLIGNFAFPIAIVVILMLFIAKVLKSYKDSTDSQRDEVKELNNRYHEDYAKVTEALNNNTNAINCISKLIEHIVSHDDMK